MTTIKTHCLHCHEDIDLNPDDFTLRVCAHAPLSYYQFTCPECERVNHHPADDHIISLLMSGGVRAQLWEVPAEALEPKVGDPISYDDLLDFVQELQKVNP